MSEQERVIPTFIGPLSVVGTCLGMIAWVVPAFYGATTGWLIALPISGLVMLVLPVPPLRQLAVGLVASALMWPFTVLGILAIPL